MPRFDSSRKKRTLRVERHGDRLINRDIIVEIDDDGGLRIVNERGKRLFVPPSRGRLVDVIASMKLPDRDTTVKYTYAVGEIEPNEHSNLTISIPERIGLINGRDYEVLLPEGTVSKIFGT